MPVVLDNDVGHRVLLYGADGSTLRQVAVDAKGRLRISDPRERNPTTITRAYLAVPAPHATAERWTYTVPAAKVTLISSLVCQINRRIAATTAGTADTLIMLQPSGGSEFYLLLTEIQTNGVGDHMELALSAPIWLRTGDRIRAQTVDGSIGGSILYLASLTAIEFDV